jgi:four helix bundle protein
MNHKNLNVWQKADYLAFEIYKITKNFPKEELYGLTSQLRRASLSIPTNIVEGYSKKGDKELARFINISLGSLAEVEYLLDFSGRLGYLNKEDYHRIRYFKRPRGKIALEFL